MNYSALYENKKRGTFDFPIELYYVDKSISRYEMPLHWHIEYELIIVLKGIFELSIDGKTSMLNQGDCAWIGGGTIHGGVPTDCVYECLVFDLQSLLHNTPLCSKNAAEFLADESGYTNIFKRGTKNAKIADKIFVSMEREEKGYEWTTVGLMWQLMGELLSKSTKKIITKDKAQIIRLKSVLTYIKNNYSSTVTLSELAAVAEMSPRYFCRAFCAITGKTPIEYLNYYRIEIASEMLMMTDLSVTEVAMDCGFNDMSYFSKTFTRYKSVSPTKFRKAKSSI